MLAAMKTQSMFNVSPSFWKSKAKKKKKEQENKKSHFQSPKKSTFQYHHSGFQ